MVAELVVGELLRLVSVGNDHLDGTLLGPDDHGKVVRHQIFIAPHGFDVDVELLARAHLYWVRVVLAPKNVQPGVPALMCEGDLAV